MALALTPTHHSSISRAERRRVRRLMRSLLLNFITSFPVMMLIRSAYAELRGPLAPLRVSTPCLLLKDERDGGEKRAFGSGCFQLDAICTEEAAWQRGYSTKQKSGLIRCTPVSPLIKSLTPTPMLSLHPCLFLFPRLAGDHA